MNYISKFDTTFVTYVSSKYEKHFNTFDDYSIWLWYEKCEKDDGKYYETIEEDLEEYSNWQQKKVKTLKEKLCQENILMQ